MRSPKEKEIEEYKGCRPFEEESARFPDDSALGRHVDGSALGTEAKRRCLKEAALADFAGDETSNRGSSSKSACLEPPEWERVWPQCFLGWPPCWLDLPLT